MHCLQNAARPPGDAATIGGGCVAHRGASNSCTFGELFGTSTRSHGAGCRASIARVASTNCRSLPTRRGRARTAHPEGQERNRCRLTGLIESRVDSPSEAVDRGGVRGERDQADPTAQRAGEHQNGHAEVDDVAHDPGSSAPPHEEACDPPQDGLGVRVLARGVDGLVELPQREEGLPDRDGQQPQHAERPDLALLRDVAAGLLEDPLTERVPQGEGHRDHEGHPNERHPQRDTDDDVRAVVAARPEGLVQPVPDDAPGRGGTSDDGQDVEGRCKRVGLLTPPDGPLVTPAHVLVLVNHAMLRDVEAEHKQHEVCHVEHQRRVHHDDHEEGQGDPEEDTAGREPIGDVLHHDDHPHDLRHGAPPGQEHGAHGQ
mmetsp:Transcript_108462/g.302486  ORF Transcript_108462/g.302486 Transcript_108462/m.302486 type:complete len:373 (-) Transcript_108462:25-1143(-)